MNVLYACSLCAEGVWRDDSGWHCIRWGGPMAWDPRSERTWEPPIIRDGQVPCRACSHFKPREVDE